MIKYIIKVKKYLVMQVVLNAAVILLLSLLPVIHRILFDRVAQKSDLNIELYIVIYCIVLLAIALLSFLESLTTNKGNVEFKRVIKKDLFRSITVFTDKKFKQKTVPGYISVFNNDLSTIQNEYLSGIVSIIKAINMIIIYSLTIVIFFDWRIAVLLSVISVLNITFFPRFTSKTLSKQKHEELRKTELYTSKFSDLLQGIRLFNSKTRNNLVDEHDKKLLYVSDIEYRYGRTRSLAIVINGGSTYLINFVSVLLAAYLAIEEVITIGAAIASLGYIFSFISPMQMLMNAINSLNSSKNVKKEIEALIINDQSTLVKEKVQEFKSAIKIDNISISFDEFKIDDFSFNFEKGKKYALIGSTGCGKSTILKSMAGINDLESGAIIIDDRDICEVDTSDVVAYLDQSEHIFSDDFNDNVTVYGSYSMGLINKIKDAINKHTYRTISRSNDCTMLSGGEKRIISVLRKFLQDPSVLLLDEPFTGVDKNLSKTLLREMLGYRDKTIIMVTHSIREEDLENFDEILLMRDGQVICSGDYSRIKEIIEYNDLVCSEITNIAAIS